jgi:predicted NBD/HSP70 family sugar kinase
LATAVNLLAPDLIVFGGHLGEAPDTLFARLQASVSAHRGTFAWPPELRPSQLRTQAGAIGGAAAALDQFFYSGHFIEQRSKNSRGAGGEDALSRICRRS